MDFLNDPNALPWLIPAGPLLAFLIITLLTNRSKLVPASDHHEYGGHHPDYDGMLVPVVARYSRFISIVVGISGVVAALIISWVTLYNASQLHHLGEDVLASSIAWMDTGETAFTMGVLVDPATVIMLVMVPIAVLMIFIYSIGYMAQDPRQARFFALISLFAGAMLTLVVADNVLLLFVGWEVMGVCSYMLIGFWFEKESAYKAAIKAFTTTRIADVVMLLGIVYLYSLTGTLNYRDIMYNPETLDMLATTAPIIFGGWTVSAASIIGIFLIIGTVGKSAQFPLHVWLPDAMEGPTPVSAMIHAAAMVSAGIFSLIRLYPLFAAGGDPHHGILTEPLAFMAVVGAFTALLAATMAVAQNDVKAVLAYSTISQLGFMMAALGIGAYIAAAFHLITHAFFKALLFMAAGSVIHGMEHGEHHVHEQGHDHHHDPSEVRHSHFDPQDMRNMGGLRKTMPVTFWTFLIGGLSLSGLPIITAGFWSKDEILADAWLVLEGYGSGAHGMVFIVLAVAAFMTAFYTMRQIALTFGGEARTEAAKHANLGQGVVSITMTLPLIVLAVFAIGAGFVGVPSDFPLLGAIFSPEYNNFKHLMIESLPPSEATAAFAALPDYHAKAPPFNIIPVGTSVLVALLGLWLGWLVYWRKPLKAGQRDPMETFLGPLHPVLQNRYYLDAIYGRLFVAPSQWLSAQIISFLDRGIIDALLHIIARLFTWLGDLVKVLNLWLIDGVGDGIPIAIFNVGGWLRRMQSGRIQQYMLLILAAAVAIGIVLALSSGAALAQ
ncbi:MAG: NADH-quinone oxidoreductase subunit L [Chloroflexi bacterium]|nr:NADH-quinone oxidoreductase subunit L [Chloroflexota bacterium]MCY4246118.1 NADH-quinone oxidoreductase subunit L [Chloroflexota bacterium]